jgi:hypothetical protein
LSDLYREPAQPSARPEPLPAKSKSP